MVSNIPFGSYQPEWKTYSPLFSVRISEKWPYHLPSGIFEVLCQMVSTPGVENDIRNEFCSTDALSSTLVSSSDN